MKQTSWLRRSTSATIAAAFALTVAVPVLADVLTIKKGTDIKLEFDGSMDSKTARPGDTIMLHVDEPVVVDGKTVISQGEKVTGTVSKVSGRGHYGVNAKIQLKLSPVEMTSGRRLHLGFKTATKGVGRPGEAAGATVGAAAILGPIGLAAGYFVVGKQVNIHPGDKLTVNADEDAIIREK